MAGGVQDLPGPGAGGEFLAAAQACRGPPDGGHDGNPVTQARRRFGEGISVEPVISEHEGATVNGTVRVRVLRPVEVGPCVHPQLGTAPADHLTADSIWVDVRVSDDQPGEIIERAATTG